MANSIEKCKQYVNNQVEHLGMFQRFFRLADFLVRPTEWKGGTFSYDVYSFANNEMGTFNNGVSQKDFTCTRVEKTLSQDRGDSLSLDIRDKNEGQIADGLAGMYNFYQAKVEVPTLEKYSIGAIVSADNGVVKSATGTLTVSNIEEAVDELYAKLENKRIDPKQCILGISVSAKKLLDRANKKNAIYEYGSWNGSVDTNILMYNGAKIVVIDDTTMQGCAFFLAHPYSFSVLDLLGIVDVYEKVPGKPGIAQIDVRDYFDAWLEPNATDGMAVALTAPNALTLSANTDLSVSIKGVQPGAKVYYKTSAGATKSDTEVEAVGGVFTIAKPNATTTFYVVQYIDDVKSEEKSITITIA